MLMEGSKTTIPGRAQTMSLTVLSKTQIAQDIFLFTLNRDGGSELPEFNAGAHIVVQTPHGVARRYSLCNSPSDRNRYMIAVKREADGGGGSISMIDNVSAGDHLTISYPENYFALSAEAETHLLIAGGIGITPLMAMVRQFEERGADYRLVYCARSPETAAFSNELSPAILAGRALLHFDYGDRQRSLDLTAHLADRDAGVHVYCCGPRALMSAVREATRHWPAQTVHFEDFGTSDHVGATDERAFRVWLARSSHVVEIPPGQSILQVLKERGYELPSSCESGTCGTCRTTLLACVADHRDYVLDDSEHATNVMICVSRAVSDELTLDL
jgi:phthalate 4,5-dioxygenase reductase subunit